MYFIILSEDPDCWTRFQSYLDRATHPNAHSNPTHHHPLRTAVHHEHQRTGGRLRAPFAEGRVDSRGHVPTMHQVTLGVVTMGMRVGVKARVRVKARVGVKVKVRVSATARVLRMTGEEA